MSIDFFRYHHGTTTDATLSMIAKRAGARRCEMTAIWDCFMELASSDDDRGYIGEPDLEVIAFSQEIDLEVVKAVYRGLMEKARIVDERLANWEKYQPDIAPKSSRERVRKHRAKKKLQGDICNEVTLHSVSEVTCNEVTHETYIYNTTPNNTTPNNTCVNDKSLSSAARDLDPVDNSPPLPKLPEKPMEKLFVLVQVVAERLGKAKLTDREMESVSHWVQYDTDKALMLFDEELKKYRSRNVGKAPPASYFTPMIQRELRGAPPPNDARELIRETAEKMRV